MGASTCLPLGQRDGGQGSQEGSQATGIPNPTTQTRISRHLLETVPTGVEETGRRLSSPGHGQSGSIPPLLAETESSSPEYPHTSPELCTGYAWTAGGPCLCLSLAYAEE